MNDDPSICPRALLGYSIPKVVGQAYFSSLPGVDIHALRVTSQAS